MQVVEVTVSDTQEDAKGAVLLLVEEKRGETWNRLRSIEVTATTEPDDRKVLLEENYRLVVEPKPTTEVVMDSAQNAAVTVPSDPEERAAKKAKDAEAQKQQLLDTEEAERKAAQEKSEHEASQPKTILGRPAPQVSPEGGKVEPAKPAPAPAPAPASRSVPPRR